LEDSRLGSVRNKWLTQRSLLETFQNSGFLVNKRAEIAAAHLITCAADSAQFCTIFFAQSCTNKSALQQLQFEKQAKTSMSVVCNCFLFQPQAANIRKEALISKWGFAH